MCVCASHQTQGTCTKGVKEEGSLGRGEDRDALWGDAKGMFSLGTSPLILGGHGPAIRPSDSLCGALTEHGFYGKDHALLHDPWFIVGYREKGGEGRRRKRKRKG